MRKGPNSRDVNVGRRVRVLRLERGLSQTALANRLGITFQQVQKYEKGTNRIGAGRLQQISEILQVPISVFFDSPAGSEGRSPKLLDLVDSAAALRLFHAYDRISNPAVRSALVKLAETIAGDGGDHPRK